LRHLGAVEGGGTWFSAATGLADGTILTTTRLPTTTPRQTLSALVDFFTRSPVEAIGVGCFGPLHLSPGAPDHGSITTTPKPGWSGVAVRGVLQEALGVPVAIQTDVTASAIGEHRLGAGAGARGLVYLTVGTGVGGGVLLDGRPLTGRLHPELGHIPIPRQPDDRFAGVCPFHGDCLEGMVSGPALAARWGVPGESLPDGHPAWDLTARLLANGLTTILAVLAPDRVILGGGVGRHPPVLPLIHEHLRSGLSAYWPQVDVTDWVVPPGLGARSALVGGLLMAADASRV
jgi:fructokinase